MCIYIYCIIRYKRYADSMIVNVPVEKRYVDEKIVNILVEKRNANEMNVNVPVEKKLCRGIRECFSRESVC